MGFSPQTFIIKWNSALSQWEYELRGSMWLGPLLEHGNTIKEKRKNILGSLCFTSRRYFWSVRWGECTMLGDEPQWRSHLLPWQFQSGGFLFAVKLSRWSARAQRLPDFSPHPVYSRKSWKTLRRSSVDTRVVNPTVAEFFLLFLKQPPRQPLRGNREKKEIPPPPQLRPCCRVN